MEDFEGDGHEAAIDIQLSETLTLFDLSPQAFPFKDARIESIRKRRKELQGQLFVDYLLGQAGVIEPTKNFPPKDEDGFKFLLREILSSDWGYAARRAGEWSQETGFSVKERDLDSGIKRTCLVYYLLAWWGDRRHIKYSDDQRISTQFAELTHAYYFLDNGDTLRATSLLCTPLITQTSTVSRKIFQALSISKDANPDVLVLRFARMAKPPLDNEEVLGLFIAALARVNFVEAWSYQRIYDGEVRQMLLRVILHAVLAPRPMAEPLKLLSSLPLHAFEAAFLYSYALSPPTDKINGIPETSIAALHSLIILRLTQEGDYTTAVKLNREFGQYADKTFAGEMVMSSTTSGAKVPRPGRLMAQKAEERREMLKELVALLPLEHRRQLESQLNEGTMGQNSSFANAIDMSWESISRSQVEDRPAINIPAHSATPITPVGSPSKAAGSKRSPLVASASPHPLSASAPIETQTLGRFAKPPTPKRTGGLMNYMTPLRAAGASVPIAGERPRLSPFVTPLANGAGASFLDRSGAPPPTDGRPGAAAGRNPFFDPDAHLRPPTGADTLDVATPLQAREKAKSRLRRLSGDIEMQDAQEQDTEAGEAHALDDDADADTVDENEEPEFDESFILDGPPPTSSAFINTGGLLSASSIVSIKKAQERERERIEQDKARQQREMEKIALRERDLAAKRAALEQRKSLGGNESSFSSSAAGGKRKRDREDQMGRSDEEKEENDESERARGKRKSGDSTAIAVHKATPIAAPVVSVPVPTIARSIASRSTRSGAFVPPTTNAPSVSSANPASVISATGGVALDAPRRSSRISHTSNSAAGSQTGGSVKAPSPSPDPSEPELELEPEEEEGSDDDERRVPGAYVPDDDDEPRRSTRTRKGAAQAITSKKTAKAPRSKDASSKDKPRSSASNAPEIRQTRSRKTLPTLNMPTPVPEESVLETTDDGGPRTRRPRRKPAGGGETTEGDTDGGVGVSPSTTRRSSRRVMAIVDDASTASPTTPTASGAANIVGRRSSRRV